MDFSLDLLIYLFSLIDSSNVQLKASSGADPSDEMCKTSEVQKFLQPSRPAAKIELKI